MMLRISIFLFLISLRSLTSNVDVQYKDEQSPWNLPLFPTNAPGYPNSSYESNKKISKLVWIGYRKTPGINETSAHVLKMKKKNLDWKFHLWGIEKHHFMETYFFNTSVLWAFNHVNPAIGVSWSDIWRLCVLWAYGGFYIDDDSYIDTPFNNIIQENDTLIVANERMLTVNCYQSYYQLSDTQFLKRRNFLSNSTTRTDLPPNRNLVNWAIFSNPRNKLIEK
jgi:mannosyltransferase OCH1-like enzyme